MAAVTSDTTLDVYDILIVILYFILVIGIGIFASFRASKGTVSGYFLAGRSMIWVTVGASLFVSNIGSEHFVGLAGSGAAGGIGVGAWEMNALFFLQMLGFLFVPVYIASKTYTMPEYLHKRFGGSRLRIFFAILSLVLYIFTKCSVDLFTGALFIQQSLGWDLYLSIFILIIIVGILTITGGLTAVIYTDTLQAALMILGAITLTGMGFADERIGGFDGLWKKYPHAMTNQTVNGTTCHLTNENWDVMLRGPSDPDLPWPGFLIGQSPASVWYWCTDQVIVQRALAAKDLSHAQGASIMASFIKILPLFVMVMPGMMSRVLYPDKVACVDPDVCMEICQSRAGCTNIAYPKLVLGIMPTGLRGLMMAVMVAALMSDLDSIFNSASTLFTIDIWKRMRQKASVHEQMIVGRVFILVMVGVAIAWVPVVKETQGGQVFIYIQEISAYFAPPVAMVFLLGMFWHPCNEQGAFWGMMMGVLLGVIRLIVVFIYPAPGYCGAPDTRPAFLKNIHYMYYAIIESAVTLMVAVIVSMATRPLHPRYLLRTTFSTRYDRRTEDEVTNAYSLYRDDKGTQTDDDEEGGLSEQDLDGLRVRPLRITLGEHQNPAYEVTDSQDELATGAGIEASKDSSREFAGDGESVTRSTKPEERVEAGTEVQVTPDGGSRQTVAARLYYWFCGIRADGSMDELAARRAEEHENKISTLEQDRIHVIILHVFMVIVVIIGIVMLTFWSKWKYIPS